ncbi:glycosyltransferase [Chitinivibrio alkaliphilus]|uniref:Family 2 glycosyl transferase n=1 Tax=Chitinivibrio alkaliphilus ACht1 TaxID=1313304 RepID=U7D9G4_9BACT|nr:glycosyltransferase family 2 protein [Chitinivibrio alkaliphilus]ERP38667.1 family 2 glycosyl transferase [Chitinivibrio alkaliphilus ACht1]
MLLGVLTIILCLGAVAGVLVLGRIRLLPQGDDAELGGRIDCSIIIPARNEAERLPSLLSGIQQQDISFRELIVVDDSSDDATAEVARSYGASVVSVADKPAGWTGKTYALQYGARHAHGTYLVFLDADLVPQPSFLRRLFATNIPRGTIRSVQPWHRVVKPYEQLSLIFNLLQLAGSGGFSLFSASPSGSFGPCMALHRTTYDSLGGHERVKNCVLENFSLGRILQDEGGNQELFVGAGALAFRMYPQGVKELWDGWVKGFASGADSTKPLFLLLSVLWVSALLFTWAPQFFLQSAPHISTALLLLFPIQLLCVMFRTGSFSWYNILVLPLHGLFFITVFAVSTVRIKILKRVSWRGREISL